ncbi:hypothetical protein [Thauera sp.]|uniref:hypothetical protein n=1 Tax=Thauera sp. TaxID=1905334 RepID=UPI0039E4F145
MPHTMPHTMPHMPHTPLTSLFSSLKGKEVEVETQQPKILMCSEENVEAFNARLRQEFPEFHAFARACHHLGLIEGLRDARIGPLGALSPGAVPVTLSNASEACLKARKAEGAKP